VGMKGSFTLPAPHAARDTITATSAKVLTIKKGLGIMKIFLEGFSEQPLILME
jgi:hypothetical protein